MSEEPLADLKREIAEEIAKETASIERGLRAVLHFVDANGLLDEHVIKDSDIPRLVEIFKKRAAGG